MSVHNSMLANRLMQKYTVQQVLLCHPHSILLLLREKESLDNESAERNQSPKDFVAKIIDKEYYNDTLHQLLPAISDVLFLLPCRTETEQEKVILIYPKIEPVAEYLQSQPFTLFAMQNMIQDIGNAVTLLHQNGWIHGDIAPGNIYINTEKHFILGDFSSSRPLSHCIPAKRFLSNRRNCLSEKKEHKYTGSTYTNAKIQNCPLLYQDIYSFSMMVYLFLHQGNHPTRDSLSNCTPNNTGTFPNSTSFLLEALSMSKRFQSQYVDFSSYLEALKSHLHRDTLTKKGKDIILRNDLLSTPFLYEQTRPYHEKQNLSLSLPGMMKYGFLVACLIIFFTCFSVFIRQPPNQSTAIDEPANTPKVMAENTFTPAPPTNTPTPRQTPSHIAIPTSSPTSVPKNTAIPTDNPSSVPESTTVPMPTKICDISNSKQKDTDYLAQISAAGQVKILFADHNFFTRTSCFYTLTSLQELYLNDNRIRALSGISCMKSLRVLDLSQNPIKEIRELASLTQLHTLNLSYNHKITDFTAIQKMKHLHTLIATNTNLSRQQVNQLKKSLPNLTIYY